MHVCATAYICWYCLAHLYIYYTITPFSPHCKFHHCMYTACSPESVEAVTAQRITDLAEIADFIPRMTCKRAIGTHLHQDTLASNLKMYPNCDPVSFCRQVLHEAKKSGNQPNYATLLTLIRSGCLMFQSIDLHQLYTIRTSVVYN